MTTQVVLVIVLVVYVATCVYQYRRLNRDNKEHRPPDKT